MKKAIRSLLCLTLLSSTMPLYAAASTEASVESASSAEGAAAAAPTEAAGTAASASAASLAFILNDDLEARALGVIPPGYTSLLEQSAINNLTIVNTRDTASRTNSWYTAGEALPASNISPEIQGNATNVLWVNDNANSGRRGSMVYAFDPVSGSKGITAQLDFMQPKIIGDSYALELVDGSNKTALTLNVGASPVTIEANKWYTVKYVADIGANTADLYINGQYKGNVKFTNPVTNIAKIQARTAGSSLGSMYLDNIVVYEQGVTTPQNLAGEGADRRVELAWNAASGAETYNIYRSSTAGGEYTLIKSGVTTNSYSDTDGLVNDQNYYYKVTATAAGVEGDSSNEARVMPNNVAPPAAEISGYKAVVRDSQLTLQWDAVPEATYYTLQRGTTPNGPFIPLLQGSSVKLTGTSYLDSNLTNGTEYYYLLTAGNVGGLGASKLLEKVTPAAPIGAPVLSEASSGDGKVDLSWTAVSKASHYAVSRSTVNGGPYQVIAENVAATSYTDATAANGNTYYYVVTAVSGEQSGMISNQQKGKPYAAAEGAPVKPAGLRAMADEGSVGLTWSPVEGSASYHVKRAAASDGPYNTIATATEAAYVDSSVSNGTTYYYVVSAVNESGEGPDSEEIAVLPAKVLTVDKAAQADGVKVFNTIQSAVNTIPTNNTVRTVIYIAPGTYTEKLTIASPYVSLVGAGIDTTTIVYGDYAGTSATQGQPGHTGNTFLSQTVAVTADYFTASNLTISNSAGPRSDVAQAVALSLKSDMAVLESVRLTGYQDTLYNGLNASGQGRQYFRNSIIEGDVDFIFGEAPAVVMENVRMVLVSNSGGGGHITAGAQKNTTDKGYVFFNSQIIDDPSATGVYDLGRAWKDYARVSFINTLIDSKNFLAGGWATSCAGTCKMSYFSEYNSYGPGANASVRQISTQLSGSEASVTVPQLFGGWDPSIPVVMPRVQEQPAVVTTSTSFDKNPANQSDVQLMLASRGHALTGIAQGTADLNAEHYTVNGHVVTLNKSYLAGLPLGSIALSIKFGDLSVPVTISVINTDVSEDMGRQVLAPNDGWGSYTTGTKGGSTADPTKVYVVTKRSELIQALGGNNLTNATNSTPKIIYVSGTIDMNVDAQDNPVGMEYYADPAYDFEEYLAAYDPEVWGRDSVPTGPLETARANSNKNQGDNIKINIGSNTTIVGMPGTGAKIMGGNLAIQNVDNVIIRNIEFENTFDYFPAWDPTDGEFGNWNSAFDSITVKGATHIWIDHNTFSDNGGLDDPSHKYFGRKYQQHDGALDLTNASDLVTVSYNYFHDHDKTSLVGGSDSFAGDAGKERITFHHNYYKNVGQRAPRVRYGQVHVYNNLYEGTMSHPNNPFLYAIGVGYESQVYAQNNYFINDAGLQPGQLIQISKGTAFTDEGTMLNGAAVDISEAHSTLVPANWTPTLFTSMNATADVPAIVKAEAGSDGARWVPESTGGNPGSGGGVPGPVESGEPEDGDTGGEAGVVDLSGSIKETEKDGVVTAAIDAAKAAELVSKASDEEKIFLVVVKAAGGHTVQVEFTPELMKALADKAADGALLQIESENGTYKLPAGLIDTAEAAKQLGVEEKELRITVSMRKLQGEQAEGVNAAAQALGAHALTAPVDFSVSVVPASGEKREIATFNTYVERTIKLPAEVNPKTAAGVMYNPETKQLTPVPTVFNGSEATIWRRGNSIYTVIDLPKSFVDLSGHWAKADVELLASKLIVNGVSDEQYSPEAEVTRAQFAALLVRALGLEEAQAAGFSDVTGADWFSGAVGAAKAAKLIDGYEDGSFRSEARITREQMVVMIVRALELGGYEKQAANSQVLEQFADRTGISGWSEAAAAEAVTAGIVEGVTDTAFEAQAHATRAQAAVMLKRTLQALKFMNP